MKPGTNYNYRLRHVIDPHEVLRRAMPRLVAEACRRGEHRQETDADTGNEVCSHCGTVVDDYGDVAAFEAERDRADTTRDRTSH